MELIGLIVFIIFIVFFGQFLKLFFGSLIHEKGLEGYLDDYENEKREHVRRFKEEKTQGVFCDTFKYIEREKPLTDDELNAIYPKKKLATNH